MMKAKSKTILCALVLAGSAGFASGAVASSGAATQPTAYFACLKAGVLSGVGTTAHTCAPGSVVASWNITGPPGPQGTPGSTLASCATPPAPNLNFTGCNLDLAGNNHWAYASLQGASLMSVTFSGSLTSSNLTGANLNGAMLSYISSGRIVGKPSALPVGWQLFNGFLVGKTAILKGANLNGIDLNGADLSGADLTGATLVGASLIGVIADAKTICPNGRTYLSGGNCPF